MRSLVQVGSDIAENAYAPQGRDAQELLEESEAKIFKIAESGKIENIGFLLYQKFYCILMCLLE